MNNPDEFKEIRESQNHLQEGERVSAQNMSHDANILQVMTDNHSVLRAQRDCLLAELDTLDNKIAGYTKAMKAIGDIGTSTIKKRRRPRKGTLKYYIQRVLEKATEPLKSREIAERVVKAGFKTKSKTLAMAVSNAISTMENLERLRHGEYQLA